MSYTLNEVTPAGIVIDVVPDAGILIKSPSAAEMLPTNSGVTVTLLPGMMNFAVLIPEYQLIFEVFTTFPFSSTTETPFITLFPLGVSVKVISSPKAASVLLLVTVPPVAVFNVTVCEAETSPTETFNSSPEYVTLPSDMNSNAIVASAMICVSISKPSPLPFKRYSSLLISPL